MPQEDFKSAKTPEAKHLQRNNPEKDERKSMLRLSRNRKIETDLIAEPQAREQSGNVGKDESDSGSRHEVLIKSLNREQLACVFLANSLKSISSASIFCRHPRNEWRLQRVNFKVGFLEKLVEMIDA